MGLAGEHLDAQAVAGRGFLFGQWDRPSLGKIAPIAVTGAIRSPGRNVEKGQDARCGALHHIPTKSGPIIGPCGAGINHRRDTRRHPGFLVSHQTAFAAAGKDVRVQVDPAG